MHLSSSSAYSWNCALQFQTITCDHCDHVWSHVHDPKVEDNEMVKIKYSKPFACVLFHISEVHPYLACRDLCHRISNLCKLQELTVALGQLPNLTRM